MSAHAPSISPIENFSILSLYHLLDPAVLANPYPLFRQLRSECPVLWDPFLHAWVVTRYEDVITVLKEFSAARTPSPDQLETMGLSSLGPIASVMVKQMLFLDAPSHTRLRRLASAAFTPRRVEALGDQIREIAEDLVDKAVRRGEMDVINEFASPLPAIVTARMLGVPVEDWAQLKSWSTDFAEMLGNFQHNPGRATRVLRTVDEMNAYFRRVIRQAGDSSREGLIHAFLAARDDGEAFSEDEVIANTIVTMVGGQETTTNLIGNGLLILLRHPGEFQRLRENPSLMSSAVEEMLRYESPSQHTARLAPKDLTMGGHAIRERQAVIAVMAAANRDPERFPNPDRFDIARTDNRHVAFGWAAHFCFGAPLARLEGQIAFQTLLNRFSEIRMKPEPLTWRENLGLRGLVSFPIEYSTRS